MEDRSDAAKPKTKKAKQAKIAKVMREFKAGKLIWQLASAITGQV